MSNQNQSFFQKHKFYIAVSTLIGTTVGAGILGIPYVVAKAGFIYGLFVIILLGLIFTFLNLALGEIILRTKGTHQLTGYAEKYLGLKGKILMSLSLMTNIYGALSAYLIGIGAALYTITHTLNPITWGIIFFIIASPIVLYGLKATGKLELILIILLVITTTILAFLSINKIDSSSYTSIFHANSALLPWGVIIFAFMGAPAIALMKDELKDSPKLLKKAIITGTMIPLFLYLAFTIIIIGIIGSTNLISLEPNNRIATIALSIYTTPLYSIIANILAILAMSTSFLSLSLALKNMYQNDLHLPTYASIILTWAIPLGILCFSLTTFVETLGLSGAIAGGIEAILIISMFWYSKQNSERTPEYTIPWNTPMMIILIILFITSLIASFFV